MPWPLRRKTRPVWVPAGILSSTLPRSVATGTSAPRSASARVTASSRSRSAPCRVKTGWGRSLMTTYRSRPSPPRPETRIRLPVSTPRGMVTSSRLPSISTTRGRAVEGLFEGDLGRRLDGLPATRRPGPPASERRPGSTAAAFASKPISLRMSAKEPPAGTAPGRDAPRSARSRRPARTRPPRRHRRRSGRSRRSRRRRRRSGTRSGRCRPDRRSPRPPNGPPAATPRHRPRHRPERMTPSRHRARRTACACPGRTGPRWPR